MSKYAKEIADIFSSLELQQIDLFAEKLGIDEIKILHSEVLPKIQDLDRRRYLKKTLTEREKQIGQSSEKSEVISNISVSDQLKGVYEDLTAAIISALTHEETRKLFLERADDDELFVLERKLSTHKNEQETLYLALETEIKRRKQESPEQSKNDKEKYKEDWRKKHGDLQWESNIWKNIIKDIKQVNLEVKRKTQVEKPPVLEPQKTQKSFLSRVWTAIKNFFTRAFSFLSPKKPSGRDKQKEPYKIEISEKEQESIDELRKQGAQHVAEVTGVVKVGEGKKRTKENIISSMRSRFGMVLASQMVSGTKNKNHRDLFTVVESLSKPEDTDTTIETIHDAIKSVTSDVKEDHPLKGEHACSIGGYAELVTAFESEVVRNLVQSPEGYSQYGLQLSEEEKEKIDRYYENMERSRDLTHALSEVCSSWGGYEEDKKNHGYKKGEKFTEKQKEFEDKLTLATKALQQACAKLKDGESLYLETGLEGHAMQLVIKRTGNEFKLSTYDSSGALENTSLSKGIIGLVKLFFMGNETMKKNAYTFSVPQERLISKEGGDYLSYLIRTNSMAGWAQTHIEHNLKHTTMEERSHMGWFRQLLALNQQSYIYSNYMEHFGSLASPDAPPKFEELLQRPQNTQNCFAKKAQSCELYELGKPTYKKLRLAMLLEQRKGLLDDIKAGENYFIGMEYAPMLKNIEPEYLSPSELYEISMRLCEVKEPPSKEYYQKFFQALLDAREKLAQVDNKDNQLAIKRIDEKIASHAKSYYLYLKKGNRQKEIDEIFSPEVSSKGSSFNWKSGVMPLKTDLSGKIDSQALEKISEYAAAQAWKATIQLINHQIKKLSVNERYIHSPSERLSNIGYLRASRKVTLKDLENANIVTFTTGFTRKEDTKIEINVGGKRKEIDKAAFFKLVVKHKESLTNPKVIGLLDYLRNSSPEVEKKYAKEVYPIQRKAFINKLEENINKTAQSLQLAIDRLSKNLKKLEPILATVEENIRLISQEILEEQQNSKGKSSIKLKNLELRLDLLKKEREEIESLQRSVSTKIQNLQGGAEVEGSSENRIARATQILEKLRANDKDLRTINAVNHAFAKAQSELENVEKHLEQTIKTFEVDDIENEINDRVEQINHYRQKVINNHLQTNAEYRILDELSAGRMGTEKDRNRDMYRQSTSERIEFLKQGKNTFLPGSVFHEIQSLNQQLKARVSGIVERKVILGSNISDTGTMTSLESANKEYIKLDQQAQEISKQPVPKEIKEEWVLKMFDIWLKHESPDRLYSMQKKHESDLIFGINQAFHHFIEQKANIKYASLKEAGYPIDLNQDLIDKTNWKPISDMELEAFHDKRQKAAQFILARFKKAMSGIVSKPKEKTPAPESVQLKSQDLVAQHDISLDTEDFVPPKVTFLAKSERALDGNTLKFLRENPIPAPKGVSQEQCEQYCNEVKNYLHKLKSHSGLENKAQRITEFCHSSVAKIFDLPYPPPQDLALEIANTMIDRYRDSENSLTESFMKLENNQRDQILTSLIKLSLSQIALVDSKKTKVNSQFYSTIKQWEKLIVPPDEAISRKISMLSPGGTKPEDISLLKEVDLALHESPVGLEGIYEGQKGLQIALTSYGKEKIVEGVDSNLRKLADRLGMRNGDALLARQFIDFYSNSKLLLSSDGINSTQGRELFSRAILDAFQHATSDEKHQLLNFLKTLHFDDENEPCKLKIPHDVFLDEVLMRCANIDPELFEENTKAKTHNAKATESFIASLTDISSEDGVDRLLGFAKEINLLSLKIEHALLEKPVDTEVLDKLYVQLICSNLAYQLILDQASEDILSSLNDNFEYTREMSLVQANMNKLQENLIQFSSNLQINKRASLFDTVFNEYIREQKFDGPKVTITSPSSSDIPGFIALGGNKSLDVLHGVVYVGNNKLGVMPAFMQSHIALQELGINNLPFKPQDGGYVYIEGKKVKASVMQLGEGDLIVQRELRTLDGHTEMLQYISPEKMDSVPMSLKRRLNAEHFFIDSKGTIHAYTSDFKPILKLSYLEEKWSGLLLDHNGNKTSITPESTGKLSLIQDLSRIFPRSEMIGVDNNTVYVPSIAKYLIHNDKTGHYLIAESLTDKTSRRHLKVTKQGSAYTEKELTDSESEEVRILGEQIKELQKELSSITESDLLSKQARSKIEKKIQDCNSRIKEITTPEYFVFAPDSEQIKLLEKELLKLRKEMQEAYINFKEGGKDKEKLATQYEKAKEAYLQSKKTLQKAYAESTHLRTFDVKEGILKAKDFHSILHVGSIAGKTDVLTRLLGANVPKSPLKPKELEELRNLKSQYQKKRQLTMEDRFALIMLVGTELQHHLLERGASVTGKLDGWDKSAYTKLLKEFSEEVKQVNNLSGKLPLGDFSELWREIQSEFTSDKELQGLFSKPITVVETGEKKPVSINTKTTNMPIESIGGRTLVQFTLYEDPHSLIDEEQVTLEKRLRGLEEFGESIQAQEEGYYYENYGLFNTNTLEKLFSVTSEHDGIGGLTKEQVATLFQLMQDQGWVRPVKDMDNKYQLTKHPSEFYSSAKIASYLTEVGFSKSQINTISDRLEIFLYQTAVSGGSYSIKSGHKEELIEKVKEEQEKCNMEYLEALDRIESTLAKASSTITMADLNSAYLLNDYSSILSYFPEEERAQIEIVLNNGMTRLLYYKTELDHLNDVQNTFKIGQDGKAIAMLHTRRNYQLDKLLDSERALENPSSEKEILRFEQDRKMQRAFLLFESEFGHRCNARQVNIFRGLLLDDETDPDKIDSAQARMGFGKTSLLPLVALYKTGDKLVRFIVPKSALETNTSDMSITLNNLLGRRAVKDDFQRYRIETDPEPNMGEKSPRLKSLQDAKADLQKRLALYQRVRDHREVLVQAPSVRNSMECQAKIFLDMLLKVTNEPLQQKELMECISLLNGIRSLTTISVFDELDATQDPNTTEVNYTSGEKIPLPPSEIYPLEVITQTIGKTEDKSVEHLAEVLLNQFGIKDEDKSILKYITSLQVKQPSSVVSSNSTEIYLMRAILTDPIMLSIFTEKEPGTDFGVWFENAKDGSKLYDYDALKTGKDESKTPLLIAIPYSAANTPKPQGSRFDNPEVTAITTLLYYLDSRTEINEIPHLEFLIDSFKKGLGQDSFLTPSGDTLDPEFKILFAEIKELAEIEDPLIRNEERKKYFDELDKRIKNGEIPPNAFRKMLARTIIQEQIKFDSGKANSNRYEMGTTNDTVIGFSGTAGDTSSHFKENMLDPAADGNMTLGIMGRKNCQATIPLDTTSFAKKGEDYTTVLIKQLAESFSPNTRALIDVGGLCKTSNRAVAKEIALQLKSKGSKLKGVIFYDDVTNTKKLLVLDSHNKEKIVDLTPEMVSESDLKGSYFTYYDQSHSRGADIKQMDGAHAVLTLNFSVTNNDYKQAIMRMRKIVDKTLGQSFSTAVPDNVREKIISELKLDKKHTLTGNDIAFWLRQKELQNNLNNVSLLMGELDSIIKNAILQQQAELTKLMSSSELSEEQIEAFRECIKALNDISPFISGSNTDLHVKYGKIYGNVKREDFVKDLKESFEKRLTTVFDVVNRARETMELPLVTDKTPYLDMEKRIIQKRESQLSPEFIIPSTTGNALTEAHSETESQSESQSQSQSQSQTQTHSFSEVANEEVVVEVQLRKHEIPFEPVSISYLSKNEDIDELPLASKMPHMTNLFNEDDPIRCSPAYMERLSMEQKQPLPPVRYFLAREEGNPKVILINQDEANIFKASPVSPWSLYDIRLKKEDTIAPITGPSIESLKGSLLKKLYFSSFRYQITGNDVDSLAKSLDGIFTPEQLKPSLNMEFKETKNISEEDTIFKLPKWGFYGENQQNISLKIEQTQLQFEEKYEKRGVTISVGEGEEKAEVFISAKLNKRILGVTEKQEVPSERPKLKTVVEQINKDYDSAMKERKELREELRVLKETKKKVIDDFDKQIKELEDKKEKALTEAKNKIETTFVSAMKSYLNCRNTHEDFLSDNIGTFCLQKVGNSKTLGLKIFGKTFTDGLDGAATYCCNELYKENKNKKLTSEELDEKLNSYIDTIFHATEERYLEFTSYKNYNTMIEAMHAASKIQPPKNQSRKQKKQKKGSHYEVRIGSEDLQYALRCQLYDLDLMDDITSEGKEDKKKPKKWDSFVTAIKEEIVNLRGKDPLSIDEFYQKILDRVKRFATENDMDVDELTGQVMPRLCYSLNANPSKEKNIEAFKSDITNVIKKRFLEATTTPSEEQTEFFTQLHDVVKEKIDTHDYEIPPILLDYDKAPVSLEEIKEEVKQALEKQGIRTIPKEIDFLAKQSAAFLAGRKRTQEILEHYRPVEDRSSELEPIEGQDAWFFESTFELLTELDKETLPIQQQIDEAKEQKKAQLAKLEEQHVVLREKLEKNNEKVTVLKGEKSALNKLLSGIRKLLSIFSSKQVNVEQDDPVDFLDSHFDLGKIISDDVSASVTLTFTPPEFYDVEEDMDEQLVHMHGLDETENTAQKSLDKAVEIVRGSAGVIQERECSVVHELQIQKTVRPTVEVEIEDPMKTKKGVILDVSEIEAEPIKKEGGIPLQIEEEQVKTRTDNVPDVSEVEAELLKEEGETQLQSKVVTRTTLFKEYKEEVHKIKGTDDKKVDKTIQVKS